MRNGRLAFALHAALAWTVALACPVGAQETCLSHAALVDAALPPEAGDTAAVMAMLSPGPIAVPQFPAAFDRISSSVALKDRLRPARSCLRGKQLESFAQIYGEGAQDCDYSGGGGAVMHVRTWEGYVSYLNPNRSWNPDRGPNMVPQAAALGIAINVATMVGVPEQEMDIESASVRDRIGGSFATDAGGPPAIVRKEVHVRIPRRIDDHLVYGSEFHAAIDNDGIPARVHIDWPRFELVPGFEASDVRTRIGTIAAITSELGARFACDRLSEVRIVAAYVQPEQLGGVAGLGKCLFRSSDGSEDEDSGSAGARGYLPAALVVAMPPTTAEDSGERAGFVSVFAVPLLERCSDQQEIP